MEDIKQCYSYSNDNTLEDDKHGLILNDASVPAVAKLSNTEGRTPENKQREGSQGVHECFEALPVAQFNHPNVLVEAVLAAVLDSLADADGKVGSSDEEAYYGGHLESKTCDHDVGAGGEGRRVAGVYGSEGTAGSLEDEGNDIAWDELEDFLLAKGHE